MSDWIGGDGETDAAAAARIVNEAIAVAASVKMLRTVQH